MFALTKPTDVKIKDVKTLSQKNRKPGENPGAKLTLSMQLPAEALDFFGKHFTEVIYEAPVAATTDVQKTIEGVEPAPKKSSRLTEIGSKIAKLPLTFELTGYTTEIVIGTGRPESNILVKDCILSNWVLQFKEGGTIVASCWLESADISKIVLGELGCMKSRTMSMTMLPPEVHQQDIEDDAGAGDGGAAAKPAPARKPGAAERAAVAKAGGDAGPVEPHKAAPAPAVSNDAAWPFPKNGKGTGEVPPQSATTERPATGTRTARGRDKTKAALEAGAAAHAAGEAA